MARKADPADLPDPKHVKAKSKAAFDVDTAPMVPAIARMEASTATPLAANLPSAPGPDRRAIAAKIAEEARRKAKNKANPPAPEPAPKAEKPAPKAEKPAPKAEKPAPKAVKPPTGPKPPPEGKDSGKSAKAWRARSAADIIKAAAEAESTKPTKKAAPPPAEPARAPQKASSKKSGDKKKAAPKAEAEPLPRATPGELAAVLQRIAGGARVIGSKPVPDLRLFRGLWTAHCARALADGNLQLAVTAGVLIDAAQRVPKDQLIAARVEISGEQYALWVDAERGVVLGIAQPAGIYLAGTSL